jgi:hypothetical protein
MRKGVVAATSFVDKLQSYVDEWASVAHEQNVVTEHRLHDGAAWIAYLQWYLPRTQTRVTYVPATLPPPPTPDHDRILPDTTYPVRQDQIVVWTSLGPLPRWVPGPTTRWAPGTTRLVLHGI